VDSAFVEKENPADSLSMDRLLSNWCEGGREGPRQQARARCSVARVSVTPQIEINARRPG